jgi:NADH dehydrogenase (ubiquinone) 1 alpha subcomplex subunit 6
MYSLNMPVSKIRTKVRQQFEKHRYVKQLNAVDVLLAQSNMEFQVRFLELEEYWAGLTWPYRRR